jgi:protein TonB
MTANDRFKRSFSSWLWMSMILATFSHFAMVSLWPELTAQDISRASDELFVVDIPDEIVIPPPPEAIPAPALPVISTAVMDKNLTMAPTTFAENPVNRLPPPPDAVVVRDRPGEHPFTPYTVKPGVKNRGEVRSALAREYPALLRDAGIGGTAEVWFHIDEEGVVTETQVKTSSGHEALDLAALNVAGVIRFTPALNRDKRVSVWISLPITFTVR